MSSRPNLPVLALLWAALSGPVLAEAPAVPAGLREMLQTRYPGTAFGAVQSTPWPGVYEVALGSQLAYVDATGQYFIFGHLFDLQAQRDLTSERLERTARVDVASLPLQDSLREVRGTGARTLIVFSDPDCPFCRKLESELKALANVTLHTFLMPLASLHPQARARAIAIWCSSDRNRAWQAAMLRNETPKAKDCPNPVDRNIALGERLGITGTPTLIAADGRVIQGALSLAQIEAWLMRGSASAEVPAAARPQP